MSMKAEESGKELETSLMEKATERLQTVALKLMDSHSADFKPFSVSLACRGNRKEGVFIEKDAIPSQLSPYIQGEGVMTSRYRFAPLCAYAPRFHLLVFALVLLLASQSNAQPSHVVEAKMLENAPVIDGHLNESEWQDASVIETFIDPYTARPAEDQTRVWIGYDKEAIYVAFHALDSQPDSIIAREIRPGASFEGEDTLGFGIDPFYARQDGSLSWFYVNALGTQNESFTEGRANKREWRGEWIGKVQRVANGWTAEFKLPWNILNRPGGESPKTMAINFERFQARTKVQSSWSRSSLNSRPEQIACWVGVQPPPPAERIQTQFLTYLAPEWGKENRSRSMQAGLDARIKPTSELTLVGSLNPDFRNIEGAVEGIDFSRRERFLSETRPFFLEGGDFFSLTSQYGIGRMFYSQRINDFDAGLKIFGKPTPTTSLGALTAVFGNRIDSIINLRHHFPGRGSFSFFTTQRQEPGARNSAFGASFSRQFAHWFIGGETAHLQQSRASASSFYLNYDAPRLFVTVRHIAVEPDFAPALGFIPDTDRRGAYIYTAYFNQYRTGKIQEVNADLFVNRYRRYNRMRYQEGAEASISLLFRSDIRIGMQRERFAYSDGQDDVTGFWVNGNTSNRFRQWNLFFETGKRASKQSSFISAGLTQRLFKQVDVSLNSSVFQLDGRTSQQIVTVGWEIDAKRALTGRLVRRDNKTNWYFVYRSAGFTGQEIYLIVGDPNAREFTQRASMKIVWAF